MLNAYLDGLERFHKITPDIIAVDYPDLMAIDSKNMRIDIGRTFADCSAHVIPCACSCR
jgi:hypothetical protein